MADRFVGMWVNDMTLDCGERGRQAVQRCSTAATTPASSRARVRADFVEA